MPATVKEKCKTIMEEEYKLNTRKKKVEIKCLTRTTKHQKKYIGKRNKKKILNFLIYFNHD